MNSVVLPRQNNCLCVILQNRKEMGDESEKTEGHDVEVNFLSWREDRRTHCQFLKAHGEADEVKEGFLAEELHAEKGQRRVDSVHVPDRVVSLF
jgi:hypothetical protein